MAKKKTEDMNQNPDNPTPAAKPPARRRAAPRPGSARSAATRANDAAATPLSTGNGSPISVTPASSTRTSITTDEGYGPSYDEIAAAAYQRYLSRGGNHGQDFDDWIEAEKELRSRQS